MRDQKSAIQPGYFRLMRQPAGAHQEDTEAANVSTLQRDPTAQLSCRLGDASCAGAHAEVVNPVAVRRAPASSTTSGVLLRLQRKYGNRFVQRIVNLSRQGEGEAAVAPEVEQTIQSARGSGQPLDSSVRAQMEPAFGADFSSVRVHNNGQADNLNHSLSARAFTTGQDIFFKQGEYSPGSSSGRELLAHELTHVVQQNGEQVQTKLTLGAPGDSYEQEADSVARAVLQQESQPVQKEDEGQVRRQMEPEEEEEPLLAKREEGQAQRQMDEEEEGPPQMQMKKLNTRSAARA